MKSVHGRHERKYILLNNLNQPVGPSDAVVTEFGSFLGTLARNATLCPLDILDWRKMDTKEDIWEYTKDKYDIPEDVPVSQFKELLRYWNSEKLQVQLAEESSDEDLT
ncbi:hypothetical protein A4A49_14290 [Nicotiana attenuata]|uniref:Uncharacterized protein n=1 Tax=Nicotiana attenuata TaxID=49451 RepID=A0A314KM65_NICAT|nr:hypothetical protein A4A49_14290 [Nicotiana attenuata]